MRLLLDTHTIFWWCIELLNLPPAVLAAIAAKESDVSVSIASVWEMAIEVGSQKWPEAAGLVDTFEDEMAANGFSVLPISVPHVRAAGLMQSAHRDPFDRLLAAQARIEGLTVITADPKVQALVPDRLW